MGARRWSARDHSLVAAGLGDQARASPGAEPGLERTEGWWLWSAAQFEAGEAEGGHEQEAATIWRGGHGGRGRVQSATHPRPSFKFLFLTRIVCGVDVRRHPRPGAVDLGCRFFLR